jgi:hypothetical protein
MFIRLEILRVSRKPTRIGFSEHESKEIEFLAKRSSLDDRRKDSRNLKSIELETCSIKSNRRFNVAAKTKQVTTENKFVLQDKISQLETLLHNALSLSLSLSLTRTHTYRYTPRGQFFEGKKISQNICDSIQFFALILNILSILH